MTYKPSPLHQKFLKEFLLCIGGTDENKFTALPESGGKYLAFLFVFHNQLLLQKIHASVLSEAQFRLFVRETAL